MLYSAGFLKNDTNLLSMTLHAKLPIFSVLPEIVQALKERNQIILQAEPGAGKSTQVPLAVLPMSEFSQQKVLMLESRRLAAKRLAEFLAGQLGEKVGQTVGYRVRNETQVTKNTRLEIITEGVLTRMIQSDPELDGVGLVIFDEFHERNLQADLSLTLLLEIQENLREDLKCLVMSATLDEMSLKDFLPAGKFLFCEGRGYPVEVSYHPAPSQTPIWKFPQLPKILLQAISETSGDVLLFFAGQGEVMQAIQNCKSVCASQDVVALPLYGALNVNDQNKVFEKGHQRKVIFSTNIAETSITLEGITAVIDSGLEKLLVFDPNVGMSKLQLQRIAKASATQRMGRAGRLQAGRCYRLWSETQQFNLLSHQPPEIERVDLTGLQMELALWGVKPEELKWLTLPPKTHLQRAQTVLQALKFMDENGRFLPAGEKAMKLHPEPRFAKILQIAQQNQVLALACDLVALLQEGEVIADRNEVNSIDVELRLHWVWQALDNQDKAVVKRLHRSRLQSFKQSRMALYKKFSLPMNHAAQQQLKEISLGELLAPAYADRIGKQRGQVGHYKLANGRGVQVPDNTFQSEYMVAIELNAQVTHSQQNARVYLAAELDFEKVQAQLNLQEKRSAGFNVQKQKVEAQQQIFLQELMISSRPVEIEDLQMAQQCLLQVVQKDFSLLPWTKKVQHFIERARWLSQFRGFETFGLLNDETLAANMDWLEPYTLNMSSISELKTVNLVQVFEGVLGYQNLSILEKEAPKQYLSPSGRLFSIDYSGQNAKVSLQLQQVFGELSSPKLAGGQVNLTFELLSPAQRPIQTTSDLANFWQTSYFDVAKEMRGRYPKHRWPEKPLEEKAGKSIKYS
ncbi:ATP-dependent helicase HrpB [Thiomicrorhabdus indica]|uniref:ATP-dependent helicase HrpB n=1 Tax=Thiomicrorhabdus indica TaxID=2267253 RepID=UPI001F0FFB82|nr:ATP-dependent helicase HrpB [Thiomicrorhabdus indica]